MWVLTPIGFFSIVAKPGDEEDGMLTVRTRVRGDLDALRTQALPELGPTLDHVGTDYPWRARAPLLAVARAMAQLTEEIDYANFKNEVARQQGHRRAGVYGAVWAALGRLESAPH